MVGSARAFLSWGPVVRLVHPGGSGQLWSGAWTSSGQWAALVKGLDILGQWAAMDGLGHAGCSRLPWGGLSIPGAVEAVARLVPGQPWVPGYGPRGSHLLLSPHPLLSVAGSPLAVCGPVAQRCPQQITGSRMWPRLLQGHRVRGLLGTGAEGAAQPHGPVALGLLPATVPPGCCLMDTDRERRVRITSRCLHWG